MLVCNITNQGAQAAIEMEAFVVVLMWLPQVELLMLHNLALLFSRVYAVYVNFLFKKQEYKIS